MSIALAQKLSQKMQTVKVWRDSGQKTGFFHNICNGLKIRKQGAQKRRYFCVLYKILASESLGGKGSPNEWLVSTFWLLTPAVICPCHDWERGGGVLVLRGQGSWTKLLCLTPGLTLHCHNYNLLNISQPNSYNSGPRGEMMITPLCRRMHWPQLLTDDLRDNDPEMAARPDPSLLHSQILAKTQSWEHLRFNEAIESQMLV